MPYAGLRPLIESTRNGKMEALMSPTVRLEVELLSRIISDHPHSVSTDWVNAFLEEVRLTDIEFISVQLGLFGKYFDSFLGGRVVDLPETPLINLLYGLVQSQPYWGPDQTDVVKYVRQICHFLYKLKLPYPPEKEDSVLDAFVRTEEELRMSDSGSFHDFGLARSFIRRIFRDFDPRDIRPRNGPGIVATGERLDNKWRFRRVYDGINQYYPFHDYFSAMAGVDDLELLYGPDSDLIFLDRGITQVMLVPKDARGPRLIAAEPLEYQYIQQGLGRKMVEWIEAHRLTARHVNFRDQQVNRELALSGSLSGKWATLDLKDASDRVHSELVRYLWQDCPEMLKALMAARSAATMLPTGRVVELAKYAPMGSALCFPVLASTVTAILVDALQCDVNKPVPFYVYGDDVIVATSDVGRAVYGLEKAGLKVNLDKSCFTGNFRESCGMDAYFGTSVTPARCKVQWTGDMDDAEAYEHYVALANLLMRTGWSLASDYLWIELEKTFGFIPWGLSTSSFPCRFVESPHEAEFLNLHTKGLRRRFNGDHQQVEWKVRDTASRRVPSRLDGWPRLLRNMLVSGDEFDPSFLDVRRSSKIIWRWRSV